MRQAARGVEAREERRRAVESCGATRSSAPVCGLLRNRTSQCTMGTIRQALPIRLGVRNGAL